jgi:ADP-ribosyl-[dinitrogen reductase] hydrolase
MRTSISHPLEIAAIQAGQQFGRVGITFCPGKYDPKAMSGAWNRDLQLDLDAIRDWGASAVVTLIEQHEFKLLRVEKLGDEVQRRNMTWFHLPIVDVQIPDAGFEDAWRDNGSKVRALLREGRDVVVHCRGGLGRAGTIASRLLIELGMEPDAAIKAVRQVRKGAIETSAQENYVRALRAAAD